MLISLREINKIAGYRGLRASAFGLPWRAAIELVQNQVNELPIVTHHIGEIFQGGVVFYVDKSQQHGLMTSLTDLGQEIEWRKGSRN